MATRIIVAISGGQDSCAMLHALAGLRAELGIELSAAHLNHGFRGDEASADALFVEQFCGSLGVSITVESYDVPALARRLHLNRQEAARKARFEFLNRAANEVKADWIALGHTQDDHVETVLLNIIRGCGTDGLRGLPAVSGNLIRPIVKVARAETREYCEKQGIFFRSDSSNVSNKYLRNRLRTELLPELETYYNPAIRRSIARLAEIAEDEAGFVVEAANQALEACLIETGSNKLELSRSKLNGMHPAIARRALRRSIEMLHGNLREIEFETIEGIRRSALPGTKHAFELPGGKSNVEIADDVIRIESIAPVSQVVPFEVELNVPGCTDAALLGVRVEATYASGETVYSSSEKASFEMEAIRLPLTIRNRHEGDRIQPLGMQGSRKLQDIMVDRKIPSGLRDRVPIITDSDGPIWVVGHVMSDRVKLQPDTRLQLNLVVKRLAENKTKGT